MATSRSARSKRKRIEEGAVPLNILLPPEVAEMVEALAGDGTKKDAVIGAIRKAYRERNRAELTREELLAEIGRRLV